MYVVVSGWNLSRYTENIQVKKNHEEFFLEKIEFFLKNNQNKKNQMNKSATPRL